MFNHLLVANYKMKATTKIIIKKFNHVCVKLNYDESFVINNIEVIIRDYKLA